MPSHSIRRAREQDCGEIARLSAQLGYPASADEFQKRLRRLLGSTNDLVLVAETSDGLAGWVHAFLSQLLESDYRVEIAGLVVDEQFQRQGIGREMVRQIEQWAIERGVSQVSVRCRTTRVEAHKFYENLGYQEGKRQIAFRKQLN